MKTALAHLGAIDERTLFEARGLARDLPDDLRRRVEAVLDEAIWLSLGGTHQ